MKNNKNLVEISVQDFDKIVDGRNAFTACWELPRKFAVWWYTDLEGEEAAEQAFHILNAPDEFLTDTDRYKKGDYVGPSLSVGDLVTINETEEYLCVGTGWQKRSLQSL